jgi:hypothetical protein
MRSIAALSLGQRLGIFIGAALAVAVLVVHNPFNGYQTVWTWSQDGHCGPNINFCTEINSSPLDFTDWTSKEPLIPWMGNIIHFLSVEAAITVLTVLWVSLSRADQSRSASHPPAP